MSQFRPDIHSAPTTADVIGSADTVVPGVMTPGAVSLSLSGFEPDALVDMRLAQRYLVLRLLGAGGMGAVYLASDDELDELIAVKVLRPDVIATHRAIELLKQEVRLARRVTHRNVARIFELGEHEGARFVTMEYIEGESLAALLHREGKLPLKRSLDILAHVCAGLQAAHDAGVIHRDIKPDNVLVGHTGRVVVSDFGVARARTSAQADRETRADDVGTIAGTPAYMSPEQIMGEGVTTHVDIYSLGVMAFEMLTGDLPWKHIDTARGRLAATPPDPRAVVPDLPAPVARSVVQALARAPDARPASPSEFADALCMALSRPPEVHSISKNVRFTPTPAPSAAQYADVKRSVAVLPFENRGPDEDVYLTSGFAEDLIDRLCAISGLRVLSRGATMRFADDPREPHEIGQELDVSTVISGSVMRMGETLQIKARAIDTRDGVQWWADRYLVTPAELLSTSDLVVAALSAKLTPDQAQSRPSAMPNSTAVELYLRAKDAYQHFRNPHIVLDLFEQARHHAPDSPLVNAAYAMALLRTWMVVSDCGEGLVERAREAIDLATSAAPDLGESHLACGVLHLHTGDPVGAMRGFRAAIARSPSMAQAHAFLGELLSEIAHVPEALKRLHTASSLDPTLTYPNAVRRRVAALMGDWEQAYEMAKRAPEPETAFGWVLTMRMAAYRRDEELLDRIYQNVLGMDEDEYGLKDEVSALLAAYLGKGPAQRAYQHLTQTGPLAGRSLRRKAMTGQLCTELAGFVGDIDVALQAIERAMSVGLVDILWLDRCPLLADVRMDPRFADVRMRMADRAYATYDAMWA